MLVTEGLLATFSNFDLRSPLVGYVPKSDFQKELK